MGLAPPRRLALVLAALLPFLVLGAGWRALRDPPTTHGHEDTFNVVLEWGEANQPPVDSDAGAVVAGYVSATYLGRIEAQDPVLMAGTPNGVGGIESALSTLIPPA